MLRLEDPRGRVVAGEEHVEAGDGGPEARQRPGQHVDLAGGQVVGHHGPAVLHPGLHSGLAPDQGVEVPAHLRLVGHVGGQHRRDPQQVPVAEVVGLDLREAIAPEDLADLEAALLEHLVLFFRAQPLSPHQLLARARQFGEVEAHAFGPRNPQCPEVGVLDQSSPQHDGANRWHCDSTFMPRPPRAVMLRAESLPALGGDTCWASMYAAYEALNP
ncbi:MAG: hypothetical protein CMH54_09185, partial [Myxococcales bacterium]|nr:hypothetical protein [Myxococcales bacterium]